MAKLTDRLQELGKASPGPLGFGRARVQKRTPAMLVIGEVNADAAAEVMARPGSEKVDAVIVRLGDSARLPDGLGETLTDMLWGAAVTSARGDDMDALHKAGCDFFLVESLQAPAVVLREDDMARGFTVRLGITEEEARPLEDLPIDLLTLQSDPAWWPLTVERLIQLQSTVSMVSKHILLKVSACPPKADLPLIRDLPVEALVVDLAAISDEQLSEIRSAVDELPPRKPRAEKGMSPVLPRAGNQFRAEEHEHEEDDDQDDGEDE
ncbi:MAG: hypothetical protein HYY34_04805 [Chloroflexi bacterium]|nr:hypothetical protein [Chloroflexota bacterium]